LLENYFFMASQHSGIETAIIAISVLVAEQMNVLATPWRESGISYAAMAKSI